MNKVQKIIKEIEDNKNKLLEIAKERHSKIMKNVAAHVEYAEKRNIGLWAVKNEFSRELSLKKLIEIAKVQEKVLNKKELK